MKNPQGKAKYNQSDYKHIALHRYFNGPFPETEPAVSAILIAAVIARVNYKHCPPPFVFLNSFLFAHNISHLKQK